MNTEVTPEVVRRVRHYALAAVDIVGTVVALSTAVAIRTDFGTGPGAGAPPSPDGLAVPLVLLLLARVVAYGAFDIHRSTWRHVSTFEAVRLFKAHAASSALFFVVSAVVASFTGRPAIAPVGVVLAEFAFSLLLAVGARLAVRLVTERSRSRRDAPPSGEKDVVVLGAGDSGSVLVKTLLAQPRIPFRPVAVLDDDASLGGSNFHGVKIVGTLENLGTFLSENRNVSVVILAIPSLSSVTVDALKEVCAGHHVLFKQVQNFEELACADSGEPKTKVSIETVLNREVEIRHEDEIHRAIVGKCVLVTGAGGSIGSEIVRQVVGFKPSKIVLVEMSEYNLFSMQQELRSVAPSVEKVYTLANITDYPRLLSVFRAHHPSVVLHAAAYKHVPLLEANCYEAFCNNVIGTKNVLEASRAYGAERFVLVSTDKAVDPTSVMGCTKRVAELMVGHAHGSNVIDLRTKRTGRGMNTAVVRFGNVINSSGSVIPLFKKQILEGRPVTVTHPEMDRYFMSIREAVRLVLTAGTLGDQGEIYLLDMGKPIKIVEVARKLMALYGRRDLPIVFTGLREGEKLSEQLHSDNEMRTPSKFQKVFTVRSLSSPAEDVFEWVARTAERVGLMTDAEIGEALRTYVHSEAEIHADTGTDGAYRFGPGRRETNVRRESSQAAVAE